MAPPLSASPIVATSDPEEAQSILSRELEGLRFARVQDRRDFRLEMNGVHLGRTLVAYNRFDTETLVDAGDVEEAVVLVVGGGTPSTFTLDGDVVDCTHRTVVISPGRQLRINRTPGSELLLLRASIAAVEARFRETVGRPPGRRMLFDTSVPHGHPVDRHARQLLGVVVEDDARYGGLPKNVVLRAGMDDALLSVLLALPHNHSDALSGGRRPVATVSVVRRAEEFMTAHASEPITISDVTAQCASSRRALFNAFRRYRGYTPMQFLKECRLRSAHEALSVPEPEQSVTSIAYEYGFAHLGRFAVAYHERFGESPSETLRKARVLIRA
jgi:AraC-like DNA-binding protein